MRIALTLIVLFATWIAWSGIMSPLLLALGLASCLLVLYLANRMGFFHREVYLLHLLPRLPRYWLWLAVQIIRSNIQVARIVLHPGLPVSPALVELEAAPRGPVGQALLANSITLTPGTVTLDVYRGRLQVHCLTHAAAREMLEGEMNRRLAALTDA